MRFDVSHLVNAPIGTQSMVHLDVETVALGDDLDLHYVRGKIIFSRSTDCLLAEGQLDTALERNEKMAQEISGLTREVDRQKQQQAHRQMF